MDDDAGWGRAIVIRDRILSVYPTVGVEMWIAEDRGLTNLVFTPANAAAVSVWVYVNSDDSMQVDAGSMCMDDIDFESTADERLESVVALVLSLAEFGYSKVREYWFLGPLSPSHVGPTSGYWGLDDYIARPLSQVVETLDPWEHDSRDSA